MSIADNITKASVVALLKSISKIPAKTEISLPEYGYKVEIWVKAKEVK